MKIKLLKKLRKKFWVYYYPTEGFYKYFSPYGVRILNSNVDYAKNRVREELLNYMHYNYNSKRKIKIQL